MKRIDPDKTIYELTKDYPELIDILAEMGFLGCEKSNHEKHTRQDHQLERRLQKTRQKFRGNFRETQAKRIQCLIEDQVQTLNIVMHLSSIGEKSIPVLAMFDRYHYEVGKIEKEYVKISVHRSIQNIEEQYQESQ